MRATPIPALSDNYIWAVESADRGSAVIVDPGEVGPALLFLEQSRLRLEAILITHHHHDHCGGAAEIAERHGCPVFGPAGETIAAVTHPVGEGHRVPIGEAGSAFEVLEVPGHTAGHVAYVCSDILLCGDTLFAGGCGRLFEGTPAQMHRSLTRLAKLPPATRVCCAHEYTEANLLFAREVEPDNRTLAERLSHVRSQRKSGRPTLPSTIAEELATNPFLRCDKPSVAGAARLRTGARLDDDTAVFAAIRAWKDGF